MGNSPTAWKQYIAKVGKPKRTDPNKEKRFVALSRFSARYRVATSAKAIDFDGLAAGTSDAYFASLRITLAYTTLEALESALGNKGQTEVLDERLTSTFRETSNSRLRDSLMESLSNKQGRELKRQLDAFYAGSSNDLRPLAFALRNLMCHGTLTAERLGLIDSKKRRQLMHDLADALLTTADDRFTKYVKAGKF